MVLKEERTGAEKKYFDICSEVAKECGYTLYDLDYISGSHTLRVFIMDPETKSAVLEDCIKVDRAMTPHTEDSDWMPDDLILEVSSPGMFRVLNQNWHFEQVVNEQIQLSILGRLEDYTELELPKSVKRANKVIGILKSVSEKGIELEVEEVLVKLEFDKIKKANLEPAL